MFKYLFFIFSLSIIFSFSINAETILEIPVVPSDKENPNNKNFENSQTAVENPSETNVNTEIISAQSNNSSTSANKSTMDIASKIKSGQVQQYGGENGFLEIHLRGTRAFEPTFYFNGLPLASALNGEQNLNLLPSSAIGSMNVYPDNAPFWLSSMGIGGDVNIISCTLPTCFENMNPDTKNHFKLSSTVGSYSYRRGSISHSLSINKQTETFESVEYTKSLEDYPVFNNHNSTLHPGDGSYENLQNNDFTNIAATAGISTLNSLFGKINFNFAFGTREQGIPGAVGTISTTRLKESLYIGTLKSEKFFPNSGVQWINQIGGLFNSSATTSNVSSNSNEGLHSDSYNLQAKSVVIIPSHLILTEQTGFALDVLNSSSHVQTSIANANDIATEVDANRIEYRPSFFESVVNHINDNIAISANANFWVSGAQDDTKTICYSNLATQCQAGTIIKNADTIYGYTLSIQSEIYFLVPYIRYILTQRRPYLVELYGSPGGALENNELRNEQSKKEEFGIQFPFGDTGIFHADDKNLIFLQQASAVSTQYINLQSGYRDGYFLDFNYDITSYWNTTLNYQYLNSIFVQDGNNLVVPRSPKYTATLASSLKDIPLTTIFNHNLTFASYANAQYESPFYIDTANIDEMSVPIVYNAGLSFSSTNAYNQFVLSLDIFNFLVQKF